MGKPRVNPSKSPRSLKRRKEKGPKEGGQRDADPVVTEAVSHEDEVPAKAGNTDGRGQDPTAVTGTSRTPTHCLVSRFKVPSKDDLFCSQHFDPNSEVGWDCYSPDAVKYFHKVRKKKSINCAVREVVTKLAGESEAFPSVPPLLDLWMEKNSKQDSKRTNAGKPQSSEVNTRKDKRNTNISSLTQELIEKLTSAIQACKDDARRGSGLVQELSKRFQSPKTSPEGCSKILKGMKETCHLLEAPRLSGSFSTALKLDTAVSDAATTETTAPEKNIDGMSEIQENAFMEELWSDDDLFSGESSIATASPSISGLGISPDRETRSKVVTKTKTTASKKNRFTFSLAKDGSQNMILSNSRKIHNTCMKTPHPLSTVHTPSVAPVNFGEKTNLAKAVSEEDNSSSWRKFSQKKLSLKKSYCPENKNSSNRPSIHLAKVNSNGAVSNNPISQNSKKCFVNENEDSIPLKKSCKSLGITHVPKQLVESQSSKESTYQKKKSVFYVQNKNTELLKCLKPNNVGEIVAQQTCKRQYTETVMSKSSKKSIVNEGLALLDISISDELLCQLAEPDDILDGQETQNRLESCYFPPRTSEKSISCNIKPLLDNYSGGSTRKVCKESVLNSKQQKNYRQNEFAPHTPLVSAETITNGTHLTLKHTQTAGTYRHRDDEILSNRQRTSHVLSQFNGYCRNQRQQQEMRGLNNHIKHKDRENPCLFQEQSDIPKKAEDATTETEDPFLMDEDALSEQQILALLDKVDSQIIQVAPTQKCTPEEIEQKKQAAIRRRNSQHSLPLAHYNSV